MVAPLHRTGNERERERETAAARTGSKDSIFQGTPLKMALCCSEEPFVLYCSLPSSDYFGEEKSAHLLFNT